MLSFLVTQEGFNNMSTYIIAEAGVNHNGSIEIAKKLIREAKNAGADAIKFQTYITEDLVTKSASLAEYQKNLKSNESTQELMLKKLELSFIDFRELKSYCEEICIDFLSTAFDFKSLDFLDSLNVRYFKIPSGEINNYPFLVKVAKFKKPMILSTGMATVEEVDRAVDLLKTSNSDLTILHCTSEYPAPKNSVNLNVIKTLFERYKLDVGYSDHTIGIEIPIAATALGAVMIEKHFTLDKKMQGPDHKASLEPYELKQMVEAIRNVSKSLGDGIKVPTNEELKNKELVRKSIVAKKTIKKGEVLTEDNLTVKRPGTGVNPMEWLNIIGTIATIDYEKDDFIKP